MVKNEREERKISYCGMGYVNGGRGETVLEFIIGAFFGGALGVFVTALLIGSKG